MTKKILLLGGDGYLGSYLKKVFDEDSNFEAFSGDTRNENLLINSHCIHLDVLDESNLHKHFEGFDYIINATGQIANPFSMCYQLNTTGISNILSALNSDKNKLFHISTVSIYGAQDFANEQTIPNPETPYAACKAFAEFLIENSLDNNAYCILRLPNLYGGNQPKGLFAYLKKSYFSDKKLTFNNNGTLLRYFLHIDDCAKAVYLSITNNVHGKYNIPGGEKYRLSEIVTLWEQILNTKFQVEYRNVEPYENIEKLDAKLFAELIDFQPENSVEKYITEIIEDSI